MFKFKTKRPQKMKYGMGNKHFFLTNLLSLPRKLKRWVFVWKKDYFYLTCNQLFLFATQKEYRNSINHNNEKALTQYAHTIIIVIFLWGMLQPFSCPFIGLIEHENNVFKDMLSLFNSRNINLNASSSCNLILLTFSEWKNI